MEIETNNLPVFDIVLDEDALEIETVEETIEENVETEDKSEEGEQHENADPVATSFYEELVERGYLDEKEGFTGSWEELDEMIADLPQRVLNSVIATMPEESKQILRFVAAAGQSLTKDELKEFFESYLREGELPNVDTADSAREFLTKVLEEQGIKPRAIQAQLDALEDEDLLIEEAKKVLAQKGSETEKAIQEKEKETRERRAAQQQFVRSIQEEIKTQNWKPERVAKVQSTFSSVNTILNDIATNPKAYVQLVDLLTYYNTTSKEFNLEAVTKKAETKAATQLKEKITKNGFSSSGSKSRSNTVENNPTNNFDNLEPII